MYLGSIKNLLKGLLKFPLFKQSGLKCFAWLNYPTNMNDKNYIRAGRATPT